MQPEEEDYWDTYRALVRRFLRPLGRWDGSASRRIAAAERRLGLRLPRLLREYYQIAGRRAGINAVFHRLLPPEDIYLDGDVIVFYEENQNVCLWGVNRNDVDSDNPATLRQDDVESNPVWEPNQPSLSAFFTAMFFMQAVNGGLPYYGVGTVESDVVARVAPDWEAVLLDGSGNNRVLMRDGQILYLYGAEPTFDVFAGAKTRKKFRELANAFEVSWDYNILDDESR